MSQKSSITCVFSHYCTKIKVDTYNTLPIKKRLTLRNVITLIKSVLNKYLIHLKSIITYVFSHYYKKIKADSYDSLPIEK